MSTKELVVTVRVPLADGLFEAADIITNVKHATSAFEQSLKDTVGDMYEMNVETVTKRGPRAKGQIAADAQPAEAAMN